MPIRKSGFELAATETLASPERYSGLFRTVTGGITCRITGGLCRIGFLPRAPGAASLIFAAVTKTSVAITVYMTRVSFISPPYWGGCGVATEIVGGLAP